MRRCEFCWNPDGGHNEGCPVTMGTKAAMELWEQGRSFGFNGGYLPPHALRFYSLSFILGYRSGKQEINNLADEAFQTRS